MIYDTYVINFLLDQLIPLIQFIVLGFNNSSSMILFICYYIHFKIINRYFSLSFSNKFNLSSAIIICQITRNMLMLHLIILRAFYFNLNFHHTLRHCWFLLTFFAKYSYTRITYSRSANTWTARALVSSR